MVVVKVIVQLVSKWWDPLLQVSFKKWDEMKRKNVDREKKKVEYFQNWPCIGTRDHNFYSKLNMFHTKFDLWLAKSNMVHIRIWLAFLFFETPVRLIAESLYHTTYQKMHQNTILADQEEISTHAIFPLLAIHISNLLLSIFCYNRIQLLIVV